MRLARRLPRARALLAALLAAGCASAPQPDPRYRPVESVLEVVAVLRRHIPDDTYRFPAARDFTGRNVYRASLLRLENLEQVYADALRAGHMDDVIAFAKGRALERLRAFDLAATSYRRAAEFDGIHQDEALRSATLCDALAESAEMGESETFLGGNSSAAEEVSSSSYTGDAEAVLALYARRVALLEKLALESRGTHYEIVIEEEVEEADLERARRFEALRDVLPDGDVRALAELQRVVVRHRESKNANRHVLELADLYAALAREYVEVRPPEGLWFDPPTFQDLVDSASRLYSAVANQDGTTEKLEAQRRLEAFLAFTLRVDSDRFSR
jgi:hypothetical protein